MGDSVTVTVRMLDGEGEPIEGLRIDAHCTATRQGG